MRKITLCRPKESFNKNCSYEILLDNQIVTTLYNGEEKIIEIPTNHKHKTVKAKIQWCGSEKIEFQKLLASNKVIVTGNKLLNRKGVVFAAILPLITLLTFNLKIIPKNLGIGILIAYLIGVVGILTIGRNKWLNIKVEQ